MSDLDKIVEEAATKLFNLRVAEKGDFTEEIRRACERYSKLLRPRSRHSLSCGCGFAGNTRNIRAHRMDCEWWRGGKS